MSRQTCYLHVGDVLMTCFKEFDSEEKRKHKAEASRIQSAYSDAIETLKRQIKTEADDLVMVLP